MWLSVMEIGLIVNYLFYLSQFIFSIFTQFCNKILITYYKLSFFPRFDIGYAYFYCQYLKSDI